jgi:hypothetical protein
LLVLCCKEQYPPIPAIDSMMSFKSFIAEKTDQSYYLDIYPNTDESAISDAINELLGWSRYRSENGMLVNIVGRALNQSPLINEK